MRKKYYNPNRQGFLNRVEDIRNAESDVDKLLDAARLKRIENGKNAKSAAQIAAMIVGVICLTAIVCVAIYMDFSRSSSTRGVGGISFLIGCGGLAGIVITICACFYEGD